VIVLVAGTRPEAIKLAPVVRVLRERGIDCTFIGVRQHPELLEMALAEFHLGVDLWVGKEPKDGLAPFLAAALPELDVVLRGAGVVVVQGDTATALAGTLAAHTAQVPVAHVEAGLRTDNPWDPWPEEWNRRLIDHGSELWFAPTAAALRTLYDEGLQGEMTGNTGIDALLWAREMGAEGPSLFDEPGILVSLHRREAWGEPLRQVAGAVAKLADEFPVVFLDHPSPAVQAATGLLRIHPNVRVCEPQGYRATVRALAECRLVVTDSGGFQEEAPSLGKPVLVTRERTERPETISCGLGELVGYDCDRILGAAQRWLADTRDHEPQYPFGDGNAAARVVDAIQEFLQRR
jgi:UDP-N-acetylglucosamine 2-epimerase (non-hydrolysing)